MDKRHGHFIKAGYSNGQQIYEKVLNIISHMGNVNLNHSVGLPWWLSG